MPTVRSGLGLAALGAELYAVGGFDGASRFKSGEAYDPVMDSCWSRIANMTTERNDLGLAAVGAKLFATGGFMGPGALPLKSVEVYTPTAID
jgi:hypothetical protein